MKKFNIGDQVKVIKGYCNASQFNGENIETGGVYSIKNWEDITFTIYGEHKSVEYSHFPETYGAYPLALDGKFVGYVYNDALELIPSFKLDLNDNVKCILTEAGASFLNEQNNIARKELYKKTHIPKDTVNSIYKVNYKTGDVYKIQLWGLFRDFSGYYGTDLQFTDLELCI